MWHFEVVSMENENKLFYHKNIFHNITNIQTLAHKNSNSYYNKVNSYISTTK
jgi:hypothetical protein